MDEEIKSMVALGLGIALVLIGLSVGIAILHLAGVPL